jgi:hypothetical protein
MLSAGLVSFGARGAEGSALSAGQSPEPHRNRSISPSEVVTVPEVRKHRLYPCRPTRRAHILPLTPETRFGTIQTHKMSGSLENLDVTRVFRWKALLRQVNGTISATPRAARS